MIDTLPSNQLPGWARLKIRLGLESPPPIPRPRPSNKTRLSLASKILGEREARLSELSHEELVEMLEAEKGSV